MNSFSIHRGVWQWELRSVWGLVGLSESSENSYTAAPILDTMTTAKHVIEDESLTVSKVKSTVIVLREHGSMLVDMVLGLRVLHLDQKAKRSQLTHWAVS